MAWTLKSLKLLYLSTVIYILRLAVRLFTALPKAQPDSILLLPSRDANRMIKAGVYQSSESETNKPRPVLINLFGSGFAIPLYGADDEFCRRIAETTAYTVLDMEYRLAPEHPFPAAIYDLEDVIKYLLDRPQEYDTAHICVSGFSSGGTLALVAPTLFPPNTIHTVIAFYPATDLAADPKTRKPPDPTAKPRSTFSTRVFRKAYIRDNDPRGARISPALADTRTYASSLLIVTADQDSSAVEAETFTEKVRREDVKSVRNVTVRRVKGCGHGFDKKKDATPLRAKEETYALAAKMLQDGS